MMRFLLVLSCALVSLLAAIFSLVRAAENPVSREDRDAYRIELPVEVRSNTRVAQFLKFFTQQAKVGFRDALARSGRYLPAMTQIFREQGLPKDLLHLCMIESEFIPQAYSSDHNSGLWQFTRTTALHYGLKINPWLDERRDPIKSTRAAAAYLRDLHAQFKEWLLVVAAFNAGESSVRAALNRLGKQTLPLLKTPFLKPNTEDFVAKFVATTIISRKPVHYGFQEIAYHDELEFEEVLIQEPLELSQIAQLAETDVDTLRQLNPALLQDMTPPQHEPFALRLPSGKAELLVRAHGLLFATPPIPSLIHKVEGGDTLWHLAQRYGMSVGQLIRINDLESFRLRIGQELIVRSGPAS